MPASQTLHPSGYPFQSVPEKIRVSIELRVVYGDVKDEVSHRYLMYVPFVKTVQGWKPARS